jgi:D-alanine-D-alanine ligase
VLYETPNTRPWKSYEAVANDIQATLQGLGFRHVITLPEDMTLPAALRQHDIHLAWLNTSGVQGHNPAGHAPAMLEMLGVPFVGHSSLDASMLDNKVALKRQLQALGIRTAPFVFWHPDRGRPADDPNRLAATFGSYRGPFVVKPVSGRASLHVYVAGAAADLAEIASSIYAATQNGVLIEPYLPGREFVVSVAGYTASVAGTPVRTTRPFAFSACERLFAPGEAIFTSMDQRAITADRVRPLGGSEAALKHELYDLAQAMFAELNLRSIVRIDIRADADGDLYVLEANPKPDLKKPSGEITSLTAAGLADEGMTYDDLILSLLVDRLDYLFTYQPGSVRHLRDLMPQRFRSMVA